MKVQGSIRRRLFFQLAGIAALLSMTFFFTLREVAERTAEGTQDSIIAASATAIADSLRSDDGEVSLELPYSALSMLGTVSEDRVFYHVVVSGKSLTGYSDLPPPSSVPRPGFPVFGTFNYRGDQVRSVSVMRPVGSAAQSANVIVTVAQTRLGLEATSRRITTTATGVGVGFFLLAM